MIFARTGLGRRCLRYALGACGVVLAAAAFAGLVRLLPWLVADSVPAGVSVPFARTLLAAALEASMVLGLPVGFALAAHEFRERGEANALFAMGVSPLGVLAVPAAIAITAAALLGASGALMRGDPRPGVAAMQLLAAAEPRCPDAGPPTRVPLVGLARVCDGTVPRVVGRVGERYAPVWFSARSLVVAPRLERLELNDAHVLFRVDGSVWTVSVGRARVLSDPVGGPRSSSAMYWLVLAAAAAAIASARRALIDGGSAPAALARAAAPCIAVWIAFERSRGSSYDWLVAAACVPGVVLLSEAVCWLEHNAPRFRRVAGTSGE